MFEINIEKAKKVYLSIHLEQTFAILSQNNLPDKETCFENTVLRKSGMECLRKIKADSSETGLILDFTNITVIDVNIINELMNWLASWNIVELFNCRLIDKSHMEQLAKYKIADVGYLKAFEYYGKKYIQKNCCISRKYETQTGAILDVYVDLKKIVEDTKELFQWCYVLGCKIRVNKNYRKQEQKGQNLLLFCHTLNGANIAGTLSRLLGIDIFYVDHLGPYNKLNTLDFYRDMYGPKECLVIVDMICQGNEFLRAKNIVEYLGGRINGCAGIIKLDISKLLNMKIEEFAVSFSPEEAKSELSYTIKTRLDIAEKGE